MYQFYINEAERLEKQAKELRETAEQWKYGFDNIHIGIKIEDLRDGEIMKVTNLKNGSNDFEAYSINHPKWVGRGYHYTVSNWKIVSD